MYAICAIAHKHLKCNLNLVREKVFPKECSRRKEKKRNIKEKNEIELKIGIS